MKLLREITEKQVLSKSDQKKVKGGNTDQSKAIIIQDVVEG